MQTRVNYLQASFFSFLIHAALFLYLIGFFYSDKQLRPILSKPVNVSIIVEEISAKKTKELKTLKYDPNCYLCPGNTRANNEINPDYKNTYSFINDFSAILDIKTEYFHDNLLEAHTESGICKVLCYSPNHSLTMPQMDESLSLIHI